VTGFETPVGTWRRKNVEEVPMLTDERLAEIDEKLTNGEYPQPMEVLRIAQELADEVERARGAERALLLRLNTHHANEGAVRDLGALRAEVEAARLALGAAPGETLLGAAQRARGYAIVAAEVHNEQTEQLRMLREEMEADAAAARAELCDVRASRDMLARAAETARTADPAIDAEVVGPDAMTIFADLVVMHTGDRLAFELESFEGKPGGPGARLGLSLPAKGDLDTLRAQWLASRFRRRVAVTFSDAAPGAEGGP
jgi:hypothetical protein